MALKKQHSSDFGIDFPEAYFRVASVAGSKAGALITVDVYANAVAASQGAKKIESKQFTFTPASGGETWDAQSYAHLKTLPEFEGAVEC